MRLAIVALGLLLVACGGSSDRQARCEKMTSHHEEITGTPIPRRDEYIRLCAAAATDAEIDCELRAKTRDDLMRCAGGP